MSRKYEQSYRDGHDARKDQVARHTVPAKWIGEHSTRNNDHSDNYRLGSSATNMRDLRIDNMTEQRTHKSHGLSGGSYISPQQHVDRITHQVESLKQMDDPSRRHMRDLYVTAQELNMDLRVFNGLDFDRR
jgi:hypothetical protein